MFIPVITHPDGYRIPSMGHTASRDTWYPPRTSVSDLMGCHLQSTSIPRSASASKSFGWRYWISNISSVIQRYPSISGIRHPISTLISTDIGSNICHLISIGWTHHLPTITHYPEYPSPKSFHPDTWYQILETRMSDIGNTAGQWLVYTSTKILTMEQTVKILPDQGTS